MFGRELHGKFPEANNNLSTWTTVWPVVATERGRERFKKKENCAVKKDGHDVNQSGGRSIMHTRRKEQPNALYDPVSIVVIGIKEDMVTAKNNQKICTSNNAG